jgi:hypothetical protein
MIRSVATLSILAAAALVGGCAPTADGAAADGPQARSARQCFQPDQVRNFRQGGTGQVYIRSMGDAVFRLNTSGGCLDLDVANQMIITPDRGGLVGGAACVGDWVRVAVPGSTSPASACRALVDKALTADEVAALPGAQRP